MKPFVILAVNNSWNVLNFRAGIVRSLQQAGFDVGVASPADDYAGRLAGIGVEHIPIPIDSKGLSPIGDLTLLWHYSRVLRRRRPVALLAWTIKPNIYGSIAARWLGVPVINNVSGLGTAFIRRSPITAIVSLLYRVAFRRSATVFFQNPDDRSLFVAKRLVSEERTALLPGSGIDTDRFAPMSERRLAAKPFTFLLISRLLRDKGVVEYVEAARRTRREHPHSRFEILGSLNAANRTAIDRTQLDAWTDEGIVVHLGEADDVRPFINAADCIVLPSYREGMPRSLLEGAAMGKPLIATEVPGCVEIVRDGVNGMLCAARDAHSLSDAMNRMIDMAPHLRDAMGEAGRRIAVDEFTEHRVTDRYLAALAREITFPHPSKRS